MLWFYLIVDPTMQTTFIQRSCACIRNCICFTYWLVSIVEMNSGCLSCSLISQSWTKYGGQPGGQSSCQIDGDGDETKVYSDSLECTIKCCNHDKPDPHSYSPLFMLPVVQPCLSRPILASLLFSSPVPPTAKPYILFLVSPPLLPPYLLSVLPLVLPPIPLSVPVLVYYPLDGQ